MKGKFVSFARKSGDFTADGRQIHYDNVVLYIIKKGQVYENATSKVEGKPIELEQVKVSAVRYSDIVNVPLDQLDGHLNKDIEVFYDLRTYNGNTTAVVDRVVIG